MIGMANVSVIIGEHHLIIIVSFNNNNNSAGLNAETEGFILLAQDQCL